MINYWNDAEAKNFKTPLELRVYTSRLLGKSTDLVLHGGGNTSVKDTVTDIFGETKEVLFVKGSGWDLATIEKEGFAPVEMSTLLKMAELPELSDTEMVRYQRLAMTDPSAPNPSVEAILHAILPFKFVDHTHADSVVAITNTPDGDKKIKEIYGDRVLSVPYVMPGFILARKFYEILKKTDLSKYDAVVLLNHGVFTFDDDAKKSYDKMVSIVSEAEDYLNKNSGYSVPTSLSGPVDHLELASIRKEASLLLGAPMIVRTDRSGFAALDQAPAISTRGPLTPDHVIRTKKDACIIESAADVKKFGEDYEKYFQRNTDGNLTILDKAPRWGVWKGVGTLSFGKNDKDAKIIEDIKEHTMKALLQAEGIGGYVALSEKDVFEMEYWELEQAKLKKGGSKPEFQGKVALVTGGASGIGKACVDSLLARGCCVTVLDIDKNIENVFSGKGSVLPLQCDVTDESSVRSAIQKTVERFGGLDILVNNAGIFPSSKKIEEMDQDIWERSLKINLTAQQMVLKECVPFLKKGWDPVVLFVVSKNVPAPGVGAGAYSVAKAGATQLGRIAALELAPDIRVQMVHPDAVFDTGIWTEEVLEKRAAHYGMTVDAYKRRNLLKSEITSHEVAELTVTLASSTFAKTTGLQVPIDGGNDRVI